jgi:Domain of unknown function (DUF397)
MLGEVLPGAEMTEVSGRVLVFHAVVRGDAVRGCRGGVAPAGRFHRHVGFAEGGTVMWRRSSFCADRECVEVRRSCASNECVELRDSRDPEKTVTVSDAGFAAFIAGVKAGEFDDLVG